MKSLFAPLVAFAIAFTAPAIATAEDKTAEEYLIEAAKVLHHSCRSVEEKFGEDDEAVVDVVEKMIAVSLYNREIDFTQIELTPEEGEELWREFADELGDRCADDANALLAGIVDGIVAELVQFY